MRTSWFDGFGPTVFQAKGKEEYIQGMTNCSVQNTGNCIESGEMRTETERKRLWQLLCHDRVWGLPKARRSLMVFSRENNMTRFVLKK